jgi:hypothetical protein
VAKKKRPRISTFQKAIGQQIRYLARNLTNIDALIACGAEVLPPGHLRHFAARRAT